MRQNRLLTLLVLLITAVSGAWADDWTDIIINGNMEGSDRQCFFVKENGLGSENLYYARIQDGIGKDGSRAIVVQSTGNETETWDTQFFLRLPYELPAGTKYKVSFDYKADVACDCDLQSQNEPAEYIIWYINETQSSPACSFKTDWDTYNSGELIVPSVCDGSQTTQEGLDFKNNFQTISFSLAKNQTATKFYIDNIKFEILSSDLSGLTKSPAPKALPQYPVEITSMAIMGDFLEKGAEGNWNTANAWALTKEANVWKLTKEFTAEAKTYEYKVFANGNMDDFTYPVEEKATGQFVISEAGKYILNIFADPEGNTVSVKAVAPVNYTVKMKEGVKDAANWTITPAEAVTDGVYEGTRVSLQYTGRLKVKSVTATSDAVPVVNIVDLSTLKNDTELKNGDVVTGTLDGAKKITIADGATVTLDGVTINGVHSDWYQYAGITCLGDATIILKDGTTNTVTGFDGAFPGIKGAAGKTLTITGTGSLNASCDPNGSGAGIGSASYSTYNPDRACGNIVIEGGTITAVGGYSGAGIGSGNTASCGNITIKSTVTHVTATKGKGAPDSIGAGKNGSCGTKTIEDSSKVTEN